MSWIPLISPVVNEPRLLPRLLRLLLPARAEQVDDVSVDGAETEVFVEQPELVGLEAGVALAHLAADPREVRVVAVVGEHLARGDDPGAVPVGREREQTIGRDRLIGARNQSIGNGRRPRRES